MGHSGHTEQGGRARKPPEPAGGSERRFLPWTVCAGVGGSDRAGDTGWGKWRSPLAPLSSLAPQLPCHSYGHSRSHGGHQCSPPCPCACGCWPRCPPCPPQPLCPQLTDLLSEDLVKCHLSPVLQVLLHDAADAGDTSEGLSRAPDEPLLPTPPLLLLLCPQAPVAHMSYHPVCPHPSVARCWVPGSQRVPCTRVQGRVGKSVPPKKALQVPGSEGAGGHRGLAGGVGTVTLCTPGYRCMCVCVSVHMGVTRQGQRGHTAGWDCVCVSGRMCVHPCPCVRVCVSLCQAGSACVCVSMSVCLSVQQA